MRDIQRDLLRDGLGLKIFADPAQGSRHNRGATVDLTVVDLRTGTEIAMPTPYDDFTPRARQDYSDLSPEVIANRARLRDAMTRHGFDALPSEWWHFDYRGRRKFELMDIPLSELVARGARERAFAGDR